MSGEGFCGTEFNRFFKMDLAGISLYHLYPK